MKHTLVLAGFYPHQLQVKRVGIVALQQDKRVIKEQHALSPQWSDHHGDVLAVLQESVSRAAEHIPQPAAEAVPQGLCGHSLVQGLSHEGLQVSKQGDSMHHQLLGRVALIKGVPEAQQEKQVFLHVLGEWLAEGLAHRGAHRALRAPRGQ